MTSPISALARRWVRARATQVMEYTCRVERPSSGGTYDEDTLIYTPAGLRTVIYEGPCRIWEISSNSLIAVGDVDVVQQTTNFSIPWDTDADIKRYDEVLVLEAPQDSTMAGKRFEVQSGEKAGELRATRRYQITGVN